jgi:acetyl esterase/lipase
VKLPHTDVPFSNLVSEEAKRAFIRLLSVSPPKADKGIAAQRAFYRHYNDVFANRMKELFPVTITEEKIEGVSTEMILPREGVSDANRSKVLINLHGGGFLWGEGSGGEVESIPIASMGRIKVITIFYRQAPESKFPAASQDVAAVYRSLLSKYEPGNIGIYGCSAGGILTAESIAWFNKVGLPMPGAIGTFCGFGAKFDGDSAFLGPRLTGSPDPKAESNIPLSLPYFEGADPTDPLVLPIVSPELLAKFPPTLLIGGSRDLSVSSLFHAQRELTKCGVEADLHVWDGMWHAFFVDPDLPESKEVYRVIVQFFSTHLGRANSH